MTKQESKRVYKSIHFFY